MSRRVKLEGHVDDPFTRRKTVPKIATAKQKAESEDEEMEMTTERLLFMEEKKKLKLEEEKQKQLQQREDIRRKMEDEDAGALTKKGGKKSGGGSSSKASTQDIFNAHNFDLDINVSEMGVSFFNVCDADIIIRDILSNICNTALLVLLLVPMHLLIHTILFITWILSVCIFPLFDRLHSFTSHLWFCFIL